MEVDEESATTKLEYEGETFYFCSEECKTEFAEDPEGFLEEEEEVSE
jgi:Cu+-exporting ATPase